MMNIWPARVVLVGAGKMGGAMAAGWLDGGLEASSLTIVEPNPSLEIEALAARGTAINPADPAPPDVLVLAVKPQSLDAVAPQIGQLADEQTLVLSILAGKTIANLKARLPRAGAVVRAMPNTPAAVRQGVTVACAGPGVSVPQRTLCERLLQAIGLVAWADDEALLDPVTAVSGSGPAYVFLLAELLEQAAVEQGIPAEMARLLARQTVAGSGALLAGSTEDAAALRRAVTSPAGTTEAALKVLMAPDAWPAAMSRAIAAATVRSRELAG